MKKILVADDEARIRRLVCDFLKNSGYETVEAVESAIAENPESERIIRAVVDAIADEMGKK